jgi:hypothetical protein
MVEVESFVGAYVGMIEFLDMDEISFGFGEVVFRNLKFFDGKHPLGTLVLASINAAVGPLPQFLKQLVLVFKTVVDEPPFADGVGGVDFGRGGIGLFLVEAVEVADGGVAERGLVLELEFACQFLHEGDLFEVGADVVEAAIAEDVGRSRHYLLKYKIKRKLHILC